MLSFAKLCSDPLVFEPISSMNSVFYDSANSQVFTLRARGAMGVNVKSLESRQTSNFRFLSLRIYFYEHFSFYNYVRLYVCFRISDKGEVISVKFNPKCTVLSVQRKRNSVDFINFDNGRPENIEYSQSCKKSSKQIFGFVWPSANEIIFVTNEGFELHQVIAENRVVKALKHGTVQTNWYNWDPLNKVLLISTGELGNRLAVTSFDNGSLTRCSSFDVPEEEILPASTGAEEGPRMLQQKNCLLANLYGQLYACILSRGTEGGVHLVLYQIMRKGRVERRHSLVVPEVGRISVSFVRDLVVVHHQHSLTSLAYDISAAASLSATPGDGRPRLHYPLLPPVSLAEVTLPCKNIPALSLEPAENYIVPLYAPSWIIFPPNVVIDGKLGCLWTIDLNLEAFTTLIQDPFTLVDCLLNRSGAKPVLRSFCQDLVSKLADSLAEHDAQPPSAALNSDKSPVEILSGLLVRFAEVQKAVRQAHERLQRRLREQWNGDRGRDSSSPEPICRSFEQSLEFSPDDVYETIFASLASLASGVPKIPKILSHLILCYIRELKIHNLFVDPMFYSLLVDSLVKGGDFSRLVHLLRSGVVIDSTDLANQLLSIDSRFPAAGQLALDMLQRLGNANENMVEVLLAKGDPITALRFCKEHRELLGLTDIPRKVLDAARIAEDPMVFYSVFRFFERAVPIAAPMTEDPKFRPYAEHFVDLFGPGSLIVTNR